MAITKAAIGADGSSPCGSKDAKMAPIAVSDPVAIVVPTWHIETWIAWLCGHRPLDEQTRYKPDDVSGGVSVARSGAGNTRRSALRMPGHHPPRMKQSTSLR